MDKDIDIEFTFVMKLRARVAVNGIAGAGDDREFSTIKDKKIVTYIKKFLEKFINEPKLLFSFYLENLLGLFSGSDLYDMIKEHFKIKEDEIKHFYPAAIKCEPEVKDFIISLFQPETGDEIMDIIGLSKEARMILPKLGKKNLDFCDRTLIYGKNHEVLVTKFLDIAEMERDMALLKQLQRILSILGPINAKMEDTYMELSAEVYAASRTIYRTAKNADKAGVAGMKAIVSDLSERYKKQFEKKDESTDESTKAKGQEKKKETSITVSEDSNQ